MSTHTTDRVLSVIGASASAGAYGPGQEGAPAAFREHGLIGQLPARGIDVLDHGDGATAHWRTDETNPTAANAGLVVTVARELAASIASALADDHNALALPNCRALRLTEINPDHAPDEAHSFGRLIAMLGDVLERRTHPARRSRP